MEEESLNATPVLKKEESDALDSEPQENVEPELDTLLDVDTVEEYKSDEHITLIKSATNLIADYATKLGPAYEMNKSIAIYLLNAVVKSTSGSEALHKLEELIEMMEHLLAEVNAISAWNEKYPQGQSVVADFPKGQSLTVYDAREPSQIIGDDSLNTISIQSTQVKENLIEYMREKFPTYLESSDVFVPSTL